MKPYRFLRRVSQAATISNKGFIAVPNLIGDAAASVKAPESFDSRLLNPNPLTTRWTSGLPDDVFNLS